jgi:hypothetical protein
MNSHREGTDSLFRVDSLNVRDDSEIDWKTLPDPNWNLWSAHTLQRRWLTMKRSVRGYEDMTHAGSVYQLASYRFAWMTTIPRFMQKS